MDNGIDWQIFIGSKNSHYLNKEFKDGKSVVAKDFKCAKDKNKGDITFSEYRNKFTYKIEMLTFASILWQLFKAAIYGVLNSFEKVIGKNLCASSLKAHESNAKSLIPFSFAIVSSSLNKAIPILWFLYYSYTTTWFTYNCFCSYLNGFLLYLLFAIYLSLFLMSSSCAPR